MNNKRVVKIDFYRDDDSLLDSVNYPDIEVDEERAILVVEHESKHACEYGIIHFASGNTLIHQN